MATSDKVTAQNQCPVFVRLSLRDRNDNGLRPPNEPHTVLDLHLASVPRVGERIATEDATYQVVQVTHSVPQRPSPTSVGGVAVLAERVDW